MDSAAILCVLSSLLALSLPSEVEPKKVNPQITVMGIVYCDTCSNNSFSRHSYFLPGAEVRIDCKFKATSPRTVEEIEFSANRTTDKYGVYKLEVPSVDGVECARNEEAIESSCRASLMWSTSSSCNVPGYRTTSGAITVKSRRANLCIYSLSALNYRPPTRENTLC